MSKIGLITVSNEVYEFAIQCRDKYLSKENKTAVKLQEIIKKLEKETVTSNDMEVYHENWKDYEVSQLLADAIKESEK